MDECNTVLSFYKFYRHLVSFAHTYLFGPQLSHIKQILDSSKMKEFADDNSKFDENGRQFFKQVENTVGKREIACYEQFLLFSQCFQKTCTADT